MMVTLNLLLEEATAEVVLRSEVQSALSHTLPLGWFPREQSKANVIGSKILATWAPHAN